MVSENPLAIKVRLCKSLFSNDKAVLEFNGEFTFGKYPDQNNFKSHRHNPRSIYCFIF